MENSIADENSIDESNDRNLLKCAHRTPLMVILFLVSLLLPISFSVGSLSLKPYRVILLLAATLVLIRVVNGKLKKVLLCDYLMLAHGTWLLVDLIYHLGPTEGLESGGIAFLEITGSYFLARVYINNFDVLRNASGFLLLVCCFLTPAAIIESTLGFNLFGKSHTGDGRMGLNRAQGPFVHPIHLGVFGASVVSMSFLAFKKNFSLPSLICKTASIAVAFTSLSSASFAVVALQVFAMSWDWTLSSVRQKWRLFLALLGACYVAVSLFSNRTPLRVALSYLTFNSHNAYNRITIWEYGKWDVINNPIFGIGNKVWSKPSWMTYSSSMDNFWLVIGVKHGFPGVLTLVFAVVFICVKAGKASLSGQIAALRKAWIFMMVAIALVGFTVHLWDALYAYYGFLLGLGAVFLLPDSEHKNTQLLPISNENIGN
jgi:hypothetical protein